MGGLRVTRSELARMAVAVVIAAVLGVGTGLAIRHLPASTAGGTASTPRQTGLAAASPAASGPTPVATARPRPAPTPVATRPATVVIAVSLPLSGSEAATARPAADGVRLAVDEANASGLFDVPIELRVLDYAVEGVRSAEQGARDVQDLVGDPSVVGVVGPFNSAIARAQIPLSNAAGLLMCSPGTTMPSLTKGPEAVALRVANPDRISYLRVVTPDDREGTAMARYAMRALGATRAGIVSDGETYGAALADAFADAWVAGGGTVVGRLTATRASTAKGLAPFRTKRAEVVFFGGVTANGAADVRRAMSRAGLPDVPFIGGGGIVDGAGSSAGSFIDRVGGAGSHVLAAVSGVTDFPGREDFEARYRAALGTEPGASSGAGYACAQVILAAIRDALDRGVEATREVVRAAATDPDRTFTTIFGRIHFDANGDMVPGSIGVYALDPSLDGGAGDWRFLEQVTIPEP